MTMMGTTSGREAVVKTGDVVEGRYRIIKTLGEGGMGTVFLAEHALIKRRVAIKILHPELATDANVIERFMNEARAAGTLGHPNIVESTDMGFTHNHVPYIVFEYLEGTLLTDEIYRVGGLPVRRTVRIAMQIASALHAAHNAGIVHRDLKSDNVFLTDKDDALDHVKVLDFGISRFLMADEKQKGLVMGTPEFMAPEQITDPDNVDKRADIYALGVILYEMLTARRPFSNDDDPRQLLNRIVHEAPPPLMRPEVPHSLVEMILNKLLAKRREDRYQTMSDVEAALDSFITRSDGTPVPGRRGTQPLGKVEDGVDLARDSSTIPRPARIANTPMPGSVETLDTAMKSMMLPQAHARRPYALYAVAGIGIAVGAIGLVVGMRGSKESDKTAMIPAPTPAPAPAAAMPAPREVQKIEVQLEADAPNSHVVFRRRVEASPATIQIAATDVVELVEVSAPGYKTSRYWLTFDRATHLHAHLVKGTGMAEASEEDTLVALGEVSAPAIAQPATTPVATKTVEHTTTTVAARTPEPTRVASLAPRKIGRAAAEPDKHPIEAPQMMAPDLPTITEEPVAKVDPKMPDPVVAKPEPKTEPKIDPTPVAKADPTPLPEPTKPEPAMAKPDLPAPTATPAIDNATVSSVVGTHRPEVLKCVAAGKKADHAMKGTITLQLQVDSGGKVHRVQVQSTLHDPLVDACVVNSANAWKFPARSGSGELASVTYPFTIN